MNARARVDKTMSDEVKYDPFIGRYIDCWLGQSTDDDIRKSATTGGIVTTLLTYALKKEMVDGALVTKSCGVKPRVILAESESEIRSASGSKYCPVPLVSSINLLSEKKGKFAVVGLPCHIRAIRRLETRNKELKDKIVLHIGLFCSHSVSFSGTKFLLENLGIKLEDVLDLMYRRKIGKETGMLIRMKDGSEKFVSSWKYWSRFFMFFFVPPHCLKCQDMTAELSDISVGDAWLRELKAFGSVEYCIFITRNKAGQKLVKLAMDEDLIKCQKSDSETVIRSQKTPLHFKKRTFSLFGLMFRYLIVLGSIISLKLKWYSFLKIWIRIFRVRARKVV